MMRSHDEPQSAPMDSASAYCRGRRNSGNRRSDSNFSRRKPEEGYYQPVRQPGFIVMTKGEDP